MKQTATVELAGGKTLQIETGHLAKQAQGSAIVRQGDNVVLGTACASPDPREGIDFFSLTVDYREYTYAGGRIPGGFIKREGRPQERETLTARQIDRPIRPLFPEGFRNETQVISLVLSADTVNDPDVLAINAASCALTFQSDRRNLSAAAEYHFAASAFCPEVSKYFASSNATMASRVFW